MYTDSTKKLYEYFLLRNDFGESASTRCIRHNSVKGMRLLVARASPEPPRFSSRGPHCFKRVEI